MQGGLKTALYCRTNGTSDGDECLVQDGQFCTLVQNNRDTYSTTESWVIGQIVDWADIGNSCLFLRIHLSLPNTKASVQA